MIKEQVSYFLHEGISLKQIALYSGVNYTTLSKWLNNERELNAQNQNKVKLALEKIVYNLNQVME